MAPYLFLITVAALRQPKVGVNMGANRMDNDGLRENHRPRAARPEKRADAELSFANRTEASLQTMPPSVAQWLSPFKKDDPPGCFRTNNCAPCPAAEGETDPEELESCNPATDVHADVLEQITDATTQCTGKVVLESSMNNPKRVPTGKGRFVCEKCEKTATTVLITIANAEHKPACKRCHQQCILCLRDQSKCRGCCQGKLGCNETVCTGHCLEESSWQDLTGGGTKQPDPDIKRDVYTWIGQKDIQGCTPWSVAPGKALFLLLATVALRT